MCAIMRALAASLAMGLASPALAEKSSEFFPDYANYNELGKKFLDSIEPQTGLIKLPSGVTLNLTDKFYYVSPEDARAIITEVWGNPPESARNAAGMLFPGRASPLGGTWGIELHPDQIGYVDDKDAATIDYNELLSSMQRDTSDGNRDRVKAGFPPVTLVGWAQPPKYDPENKRLYWAKELKFGDSEKNTLNYDIRFLNRHGVYVMSYIASMENLDEVNASLPEVLNAVSFEQGSRYEDFVPGVDKVAAVGIGGLIAGKVVAKTGLLVLLAAFAKKFGVIVLLPLAWAWRKFRSIGKRMET